MLNLNINGSRAIAALLVFLFHINLDAFSGGYIGVDIFFVISGYVISKSTYRLFLNNNNKKNLVLLFYGKRLLRILPAIIILSIFLLIFTKFLFLDKHYIKFLKSLFYSNTFLSNIFFWNQYGYFGLENSFKPMLHTWSLSIEAQIYLIFPLIFFLIYKKRYNFSIILLLIISFFSIFFAELFIDRPLVYFFPIFRIHEFFFGVLLFMYIDIFKKKRINDNFVYLGIFIILISSFYLDKNSTFPGINSIFPLIGISLIILSKENLLLAKNSIIQFYGNISYSFYLYHWPIIVIYKYYFLKINFNFFDIILIFILTSFCSIISYHFVELKFKELKKENFIKVIILFFIVILSTILFYNFFTNNLIKSQDSFLNKNLEHRRILENKILEKNLDPKKKSIIFLGDSHAMDLIISLNHNQTKIKNSKTKYINLNDDCLRYLNNQSFLNYLNKIIKSFLSFTINKCISQIDVFNDKFKNIKSQHIIISNRWSSDSLNYLQNLINILKKNKNMITIVGRRPSFFDVPSLIRLKENKQKKNLNKISYDLNDKSINEINKTLLSLSKKNNIDFVNLFELICNKNLKECEIIDKSKNILFIDNDHFSIEGSKFFGLKLNMIFEEIIKK